MRVKPRSELLAEGKLNPLSRIANLDAERLRYAELERAERRHPQYANTRGRTKIRE